MSGALQMLLSGGGVTDSFTITAGTGTVSSIPALTGYGDNVNPSGFDGAYGSVSVGSSTLTGGKVVSNLSNDSGPVTVLYISGFSADPGASWVSRFTIAGTGYTLSGYSYTSGVAQWTVSGYGGFTASSTYAITLTHGA